MRELFEQFEDIPRLGPMESARRGLRTPVRQRFYRDADVGQEDDGGFPVLLDGRPIQTPARRKLAAPTQGLAEALAAEWEAQREVINPALMPLTRLANTIIDGVTHERHAVAADIAKYFGSDLLFYRAGEPHGLIARQAALWDPVLAWARAELGAHFILSEGVVFVTQPERAVAAARAALPSDPWRLGAMHSITTLTGSALLALAVLREHLSALDAWAAAHVDEEWQMQQWGEDDLALARRASRWEEMLAAAMALELLRSG
jgi:chaperone required for assembly of F1-ATPase